MSLSDQTVTLTPEMTSCLMDGVHKGRHLDYLAEEIGVGVDRLRKERVALRLPIHNGKHRRADFLKNYPVLMEQHGTHTAVAKAIGVSVRRIQVWLKGSDVRLPRTQDPVLRQSFISVYPSLIERHGSRKSIARATGLPIGNVVRWARLWEQQHAA
jgi:hypothetical protein